MASPQAGVAQQGNTHYGLEDLSLMRAIPNMTIVEPADCAEVYKTVEAACNFDGPMYIRLCGEAGDPVVFNDDYDFQIGRCIQVREGKELAIIAAGTMVAQGIKAAELLSESNHDAAVFDMHTIKPLDTEALDEIADKYKYIVTIEEGNVVGGLGSAVAEYLSDKKDAPSQLILGINDCFPHPGSYPYMLKQLRLDASGIEINILQFIAKQL